MKVRAHIDGRGRKRPPYPFRHFIGETGVPGATDIIDDLGLRFDYSVVAPEVLKAAGERGSRVHEAAAAYLIGGLDDRALQDGDRGFYDAFLSFAEDAQLEPKLVEHEVLVSTWPAYGGTLDFLGETAMGPRLLDWKCRSGVQGDGLQTVAYQRGLMISGTDPDVLAMAKQAERASIELKKNGKYKVHPHRDEMDLMNFIGAAVTWHYKISQGWAPPKY